MHEAVGFERFVAERGPALLRLAWLLTADADAAQDLVQDALAKVLPRWDRITSHGEPEPYVRTVIRSTHVDTLRRRRVVEIGTDLLPEQAVADDDLLAAEGRVTLADALGRLTARQRAVLVLRFYEDLTETATASVLGCSVSTVKSQTRHAISRLRVLAPELADTFAPDLQRETP
ncbi:SigE family RNA polymerase sigma factor [Angustibacter peucedani]